MQGRIGRVLAGIALALGGGVAGAVVVAPSLHPPSAEIPTLSAEQAAAVEEAGREARASLRHTFKVAKKARGMARGARIQADRALSEIDALGGQVGQALSQSQQALTEARGANARLDSTRVVSASDSGQVITGSTDSYVSLGGPLLSATVPDSGLIEVYAAATFGEEGNNSVAADGAIALFEDGQRVSIHQQDACTGSAGLEDALISAQLGPAEEIPLATPPSFNFLANCGALGNAASPMLLTRTPGTHTYELRYGDCDCDPEPAAFSDRVLRVAPHV